MLHRTQSVNISNFLSLHDVRIDVRATHKGELLQWLGEEAAARVNSPAEDVAGKLIQREKLGSTGIGGGVAIPHARLQGLTEPFGSFLRLQQPMLFDSIDSHPVDLVFLLLLPSTGDGGLVALSLVTRKLRAPLTLTRLRQAKNVAEMYAAMI